jgi:nitronate monooxygenase
MWPRRDLIELLGIAHPIIQAPMAGLATSALVVAVANAGGLGSFGGAGLPIDAIRDRVREIRAGTDWPYNLNFLIPHDEAPDAEAAVRMRARLALYYDELGLGAVPEPTADFPLFDAERLALILELRPSVVSFHFGLPDKGALRAILATGTHVLGSATTVREARHLEAAEVSAIIAQAPKLAATALPSWCRETPGPSPHRRWCLRWWTPSGCQ